MAPPRLSHFKKFVRRCLAGLFPWQHPVCFLFLRLMNLLQCPHHPPTRRCLLLEQGLSVFVVFLFFIFCKICLFSGLTFQSERMVLFPEEVRVLFTVSVCTISGIMEVHLRLGTTGASGISHSSSHRSNDAAFSECITKKKRRRNHSEEMLRNGSTEQMRRFSEKSNCEDVTSR